VDEGRPTLREDTRDEVRFRRLLGIAATCVLVLVSSGSITGSDGPAAYAVAQSIVDHHALTVPRHLGFPGRGGRTYASHGLGLPLVAVPFYAVARPLARATSHPEIATAVVSLIMPLTGGLLVVALYALMRRLRASRVTSAIVSAGVVGGTFLLPYLKDFYSEPLATLFVVLAVERFLAGRLGTSGGALMAAGITRPQLFLLGPLFGWRAYRDNGPRGLLRLSLPVLAGVVIVLLYNVARFNDPFRFDPLQGKARLDRIPAALVELLFNPTKSVFLFAPIVLVLIPALATLRRIDISAFWLLTGNSRRGGMAPMGRRLDVGATAPSSSPDSGERGRRRLGRHRSTSSTGCDVPLRPGPPRVPAGCDRLDARAVAGAPALARTVGLASVPSRAERDRRDVHPSDLGRA
jgi:hypothetical protein